MQELQDWTIVASHSHPDLPSCGCTLASYQLMFLVSSFAILFLSLSQGKQRDAFANYPLSQTDVLINNNIEY